MCSHSVCHGNKLLDIISLLTGLSFVVAQPNVHPRKEVGQRATEATVKGFGIHWTTNYKLIFSLLSSVVQAVVDELCFGCEDPV